MELRRDLPTLALLACCAMAVVVVPHSHPGSTLVSAEAAALGRTSRKTATTTASSAHSSASVAFLPVVLGPPLRHRPGCSSSRCRLGTAPLSSLRSRDDEDDSADGDGGPPSPLPPRRRRSRRRPRPYLPSDFADVNESADPLLRGRGYSVSDEAERRRAVAGEADEEESRAKLSRIGSVPGAAVIRTTEEEGLKAGGGGGGPTTNWYLVPLSPPPPTVGEREDWLGRTKGEPSGDGADEARCGPAQEVEGLRDEQATRSYVMVDVPPFSDDLLADVRSFLSGEWREATDDDDDSGTETSDKSPGGGGGGGDDEPGVLRGAMITTTELGEAPDMSTPAEQLKRRAQPVAIVITNRNSVHYSSPPAGTPYSASGLSDLDRWTEAFPGVPVVMHRYDVPRDMMGPGSPLTQTLDGNGPWAFNETTGKFDETGQKLVVLDWDDDKIAEVLGNAGEDGGNITAALREAAGIAAGDSTAVDVRSNEEGRRLLAVYSPGHTMGSVALVFPESGACCSGNLIPQYEARPRLDAGGLVTTNRAGLGRQVESALDLAATYSDRFRVVLPSMGDVMVVEGETAEERENFLREVMEQFDKTARLYDNLGKADR